MVRDNLKWEIAAPPWLGIYAVWYDGYAAGPAPGCPIRPDPIIRSSSKLFLHSLTNFADPLPSLDAAQPEFGETAVERPGVFRVLCAVLTSRDDGGEFGL